MMPEYEKIAEIINLSNKIVILQADNPDADSLGSALALEQILHTIGKDPLLYCSVDVPTYLRYLSGWDRVSNVLPNNFDASIIVDASSLSLFDKLFSIGGKQQLVAKPSIVLDHHGSVSDPIDFASVTLNDATSSSTGELIYSLAKNLKWDMPINAQEFLMTAILGDTQGLSNSLTGANTYRILADMTDAGVDRPTLEEKRRLATKMPEVIFRYKAELIKRTEFYLDDRLAIVTIPQSEINEFSPLYNPAPLIQGDLLQTERVGVTIVLKFYNDGRITAAIRGNPGNAICDKLAQHFGGGGHKLASGFKVQDGRTLVDIKTDCIDTTKQLLG
jgi:phosphoesterase RecJ-like protein